jgi:hypothetical protein
MNGFVSTKAIREFISWQVRWARESQREALEWRRKGEREVAITAWSRSRAQLRAAMHAAEMLGRRAQFLRRADRQEAARLKAAA